MKQTRQAAVVPAANKLPQDAAKAVKPAPIPLSERALTQVSGGVKVASTSSPQNGW